WFYVCSLATRTIVYKGQLTPAQVPEYYADLRDSDFVTHFALVHSRFSTNTFPSWERAQPFNLCAHNGEINTLRGNKNWMRSREGQMQSAAFGKDLQKAFPIIDEFGSDSAAFDSVLELLVVSGTLTMAEAVMVMVPEAWQNNTLMGVEKRAFYEWASCVMEPWDGPALFTFSDGRFCGASLDRNGLRPCRYYVTNDDRMICASEVGAVNVAAETVVQKGRLMPGRMLLVDTEAGTIVDDEQLKLQYAQQRPFQQWIGENQIRLDQLKPASDEALAAVTALDEQAETRERLLKAFGYSGEQLALVLGPMAAGGKEALGSMGNDAVLACLDAAPRLPYEYFRQLFAQVTNPPIDPIRERLVMSLRCPIGPEGNLLEVSAAQTQRLTLESPVLTVAELEAIRGMDRQHSSWKTHTIDVTFPVSEGAGGYERILDRACAEAQQAISGGARVLVISDRGVGPGRVAASALLAVGAVHHALVGERLRARVALVVETAEARETHHVCVLVGHGADAVCPYLAYAAITKLHSSGVLADASVEQLIAQYRHALDDGLLKVMSKMGISTLQSYKGAQCFEALGVASDVVERCFTGTASRIEGTNLAGFAADALARHAAAYGTEDGAPTVETAADDDKEPSNATLGDDGEYAWRRGGAKHVNTPVTVARLQDAVRTENKRAWDAYVDASQAAVRACTLRGQLELALDDSTAVPLDEVEPWTAIVRRFCTGAMSYGSISAEAHTALALAMNKLGGKSNSGEGGEDASRSAPRADGGSARSAIKQVASGRFGVTSRYLADADELQIKMAQGAKAGEGGELAGSKVTGEIARTRHTTPGVTLVSPPPHHDIYSIEDLKQLIFDLQSANTRAQVSVKLVASTGIGVVAAGVAKAGARRIVVAGHDGGTGAARWTGIKYAGLPWELGLAEAHQTLALGKLRARVALQADGQLKTAQDVAVAALLGADEFGFATAPLIALGCVYLRRCHQNSCAVGVATQDPELRRRFAGQPEHVINFFHYLAEDLRALMAQLGFRSVAEMVGRADKLRVRRDATAVAKGALDLRAVVSGAQVSSGDALIGGGVDQITADIDQTRISADPTGHRIDERALPLLTEAMRTGCAAEMEMAVANTDRAVGTTLSYHVSRPGAEITVEAEAQSPLLTLRLRGSAGQSLGAFLARGLEIRLEGDANDYVGKGLSGGRLVVFPPRGSTFAAGDNIIVGNVCLFGATSGEAFINGVAAERFAVRNSGALAVVEGVGDHGCEYMTGGRVVVLGRIGRNFAAGMSGGIAYVLAPSEFDVDSLCNAETVALERITDDAEAAWLRDVVQRHADVTGSQRARNVLADFDRLLAQVVKVYPHEYRRAQESASEKTAESCKKHKHTPADASSHNAVVDIEDALADDAALVQRAAKLDKLRGFAKYRRRGDAYRSAARRVNDWNEISARQTRAQLQTQAARCIDCGVPFCQSDADGCPLGNVIPRWNDLVFRGRWRDAFDRLMATNNFPEFTGRVCPAPCEGACVAGIGAGNSPVAIKSIEAAIIDHAWAAGWMAPTPPLHRTRFAVAIVGSGPAGLAAADQLNRAGHRVTVFERADRAGGLLAYGIPNMKLDKSLVERRIDKMRAEGVVIVTGADVGGALPVARLRADFDAVLLATGSTRPRDLPIAGRSLSGVHFAMDFLGASTRTLLDSAGGAAPISAAGRHVVVIGGGDTGNDCIATAVRQGAASVANFELLPEPPRSRAPDNPWPQFPRIFRVDYGHEEVIARWGADPRTYCVSAKRFVADEEGTHVTGIETVQVEWTRDAATQRWAMREVPGSERLHKADLVLLAMGFVGPERGVAAGLGVPMPEDGARVPTAEGAYATAAEGVYAAGDCRRGQSLVVWAISEGRQAAREIDQALRRRDRPEAASALPVEGGVVPRVVEATALA
ncbi:glutamate synthase [NADH], partial [Coemansia interrupta]